LTTASFLIISGASAQETRTPDPLFQSKEILDVRIVVPLKTLTNKRPDEEELPGKFQFTNSAGQAVEFDIKVRTRGRFRRQKDACSFPPIRLNFKGSETKDTLFHKQDKVKLVTHCKNNSTYEQALLREYTAYQILNVMTDASFRVRLMRITYVNTEKKDREEVHYGFIIEHRDRLAKRLEKAVLDIPKTSVRSLQPEYTNTVSMYHYLIGNTDFSPVQGPEGDSCCHNHVLFGNEDEPVWSIPYDLDQSGLVNAPYAEPNPNFRIRSVRQRLYRGRCVNNHVLDTSIAKYKDKREKILEVVGELEAVTARSRKSMVGYVEKFYEMLNSEKRGKSEFARKCI